MRTVGVVMLVTAAITTAGLVGAGPAGAYPKMEWAWLGPYPSMAACENTRAAWPVTSHPCEQRADGVYFYGMRQASQ